MNGNFVQSIKSPFSNFTTINNTIPNFMPYDTIILTFRLNLNSINKIGCNRDIEWVLRNESYFGTNSSIAIRDSIHSNNKNVIDISNMSCSSEKCKITDISVENHVSSTIGSDCNSFPISYDYTIKWINNGPSDADGILLTNLISRDNATNGNGDVMYTYNYNITDLSWSSSHSSKVPSSIFRKMKGDFSQLKNDKTFKSITRLNNSNIVTTFKVGDTITLRYTLNIEDLKVFGCGNTITWDLQNEASFKIPISLMLLDSNSLNNSGISFVKNNSASSTDLAISKMVYPQIASTGDKVRMTIMFQNASKSPTSPAIWIDTIPSSFQIDLESINCKSIFGSSGCGEITYNPKTRVLSQYIDTMNANSALEIIFDGTITALYTATESNRVFAVHPCHDCHPSTNLAQTNYQINGVCDKRLAGSNRDTTICNSYYFPLNLSNFLSNEAYRYGSWARISGSGGWFDNDASILTPDLDMTTNIFRYIVPENAPCPEDTSYITLRFDCQDDSIKAIAHSNFNNIKIEWIKEKEKNIDYFEVHRSVDGISFYKIAEVEGRGTTDKLHSYIYIDNDVKSGVIYYYQIKQVNLFGEELLSNIVSSSIDNKDFIVGNLYPNPTDNYFNLSLYSTGESDVNISILSSLGQEIISKSLKIDDGNSEIHFDNLQRLAQGGYYVLVNTKYGNFTKTLAIARE